MKNLDVISKEHIQTLLRFLKNKGYFSRFVKCCWLYKSQQFTWEKWLEKATTNPRELVQYAPFDWDNSERKNEEVLNSFSFWTQINAEWEKRNTTKKE